MSEFHHALACRLIAGIRKLLYIDNVSGTAVRHCAYQSSRWPMPEGMAVVEKSASRSPLARLSALLVLTALSASVAAGVAAAQGMITFQGNFNQFMSEPPVQGLPTLQTPFVVNGNVNIPTSGLGVGNSGARGTILIQGGAHLNVTGLARNSHTIFSETCGVVKLFVCQLQTSVTVASE